MDFAWHFPKNEINKRFLSTNLFFASIKFFPALFFYPVLKEDSPIREEQFGDVLAQTFRR